MPSYVAIALAAALTLSAQAALAATAPEPLKPVDPDQLYQGRWLEIARKPMMITNGCVAGSTTYSRGADGKVDVLDACRHGSVDGKLAELHGAGQLMDPPTDAKLHVRYNFLIQWDYTSPRNG
jgi:apolipoprotein D and lipocalin family protein